MKTIMVATDFSERSDRALRRATLLAKQFSAGLILVHVVDDDQPAWIVERQSEAADRLLQKQADTLQNIDAISCGIRVVLATPFAGIVQATEELTPDLLVIGPHRRQLLRDVFVGTTAERTIHSVACPIIMANAVPAGPYRHALLATDLSDDSRDTIRRLTDMGIGSSVGMSILYVFDAPALRLSMNHTMAPEEKEHYLKGEGGSAAQVLSDFIASANCGHLAQIVRHNETTTANEILEAAADRDADLVVIGTQSKSALRRLFLGSVAEEVLRRADRDVLAIPPRQA